MVEVLAVAKVGVLGAVRLGMQQVGVHKGDAFLLRHLLQERHLLRVLLAVDKHVERRTRRHHHNELYVVLAAEPGDGGHLVKAGLLEVAQAMDGNRGVLSRQGVVDDVIVVAVAVAIVGPAAVHDRRRL